MDASRWKSGFRAAPRASTQWLREAAPWLLQTSKKEARLFVCLLVCLFVCLLVWAASHVTRSSREDHRSHNELLDSLSWLTWTPMSCRRRRP